MKPTDESPKGCPHHEQQQQPAKKPAPPMFPPKPHKVAPPSPISADGTCWRRPASPLPPLTSQHSDTTAELSIRQGTHSVATLKKMLARQATFDRVARAKRNALQLPKSLPTALADESSNESDV